TKFSEGAWAILIVLPVLVIAFLRLNRQYVKEAGHLEVDVPAAAAAPILRRHVVLVFVDRLHLAPARATQYPRPPPTRSGPSTWWGTATPPATWPTSGAGWDCSGCRSSWWSARTGASPAP